MILAGGSGTRLWPASRQRAAQAAAPARPGWRARWSRPRSRRGAAIAARHGRDRDRRVAGRRRRARSCPGVEVVAEPVGRNTAAAIGLAAAMLAARDPDAVLAVLPADQHVADEAALARVLERGARRRRAATT